MYGQGSPVASISIDYNYGPGSPVTAITVRRRLPPRGPWWRLWQWLKGIEDA
jgi:hypothetical protein